jgi:hypothetical protein
MSLRNITKRPKGVHCRRVCIKLSLIFLILLLEIILSYNIYTVSLLSIILEKSQEWQWSHPMLQKEWSMR